MNKGDFDGIGYPVSDPTPYVILSRGEFIYGRVVYITHRQNMMVVLTSWRRRKGSIIKKFKKRTYLKDWEKVSPPRYMLAVEGKIVDIAPPE